MNRFWKNPRIVGWIPLTAVLLGVGVLGAVRENRILTEPIWIRSYAAGLRQARRTGRPMLISFRSPGCSWCAKMDAETFTDPAVVELSRGFVCVIVDSETGMDAVRRYHVTDFPTTLLADPAGNLLSSTSDFVPASRLLPALRRVEQHRF